MAVILSCGPDHFNNFFVPLHPDVFTLNLVSNDQTVFTKNQDLISNQNNFGLNQRMILTFDTQEDSFTDLVECIYQL